MKVRPLEDVLKEFPNFKTGFDRTEFSWKNPVYGSFNMLAICRDDGTPLWDQPALSGGHGSLIVPFYQDNSNYFIGFLKRIRPLIKNEKGEQGNEQTIEIPRGFLNPGESFEDAAKREFTAEFNEAILRTYDLGPGNPINSHWVEKDACHAFAIELDGQKIKTNKDVTEMQKKEGIIKTLYLSIPQVDNLVFSGIIYDHHTLSGLKKFDTLLKYAKK